jgi:hypothetical protein
MFQTTLISEGLILDFDIENRPLSYMGNDFTSADITAIAAGFVGEDDVAVWALGEVTTEEMLRYFVSLYNEADIVTGHYIRKHDLPIINGALLEFGLKPLEPKLASDTKCDLIKFKDLSKSQESLSDLLGLPEPKHHMSQAEWRRANRLTPEGIEATKKRVVQDIQQHKELRAKLIEADFLNKPRLWSP